jgi:hypothetical protein
MPKLLVTHEVDDVAHWLASPKREEVFAGVATNITTFVHPSVPNRVALSMDVADMAAAWYCWHASRRQAMLEACWEKAGAFVHQQIIWVKNRGVLTRSHYLWKHEPCFMGWRRPNRPPKVAEETLSSTWALPSFAKDDRPDHPRHRPPPIDPHRPVEATGEAGCRRDRLISMAPRTTRAHPDASGPSSDGTGTMRRIRSWRVDPCRRASCRRGWQAPASLAAADRARWKAAMRPTRDCRRGAAARRPADGAR